ncbi:major facilitator superfamily protein [Stylonychia lemnae]|uniref:Major facilitator superfamily protein n=1 Tax=Stylonychia lemnae TaxID=5949 RepID=A0A078APZ7_STYLE|nr:major facilitator superfamily protein [Stylonychia lemnae]|eukprot:CDW84415.1 major facilitator superfamily protein [Stylonychia lemnae]
MDSEYQELTKEKINSTETLQEYKVSIFIINYMSQIYMVAYLPMNFPSVFALDKLGLRYGVLIGITLTTLGLWLRVLINESFAWVIVGQTVMAIAQPFTYNAPAKLSANWFGESERLYATAVAANANNLGIAVGYFIPSMFVTDDDMSVEGAVQDHSKWLMMSLAIAASCILVPVVLFFQGIIYFMIFIDKPPTFPSLSSQNNQIMQKGSSLKKDMISLLKNRNFMQTSVANGMIMGYFFALTTVLTQMISLYDFTDSQSSQIGSTYLFAGIIGGIITSVILTYQPRYKLVSIVITLATLGTYVLTYFAILSKNYGFLMASQVINGFIVIGVFSVAFELGVELSYPIGEATSGGLTNSIGNVVGFILVMIMTPILNSNKQIDVLICSILFIGVLVIAIILIVITKFELIRSKIDQQQIDNSKQFSGVTDWLDNSTNESKL